MKKWYLLSRPQLNAPHLCQMATETPTEFTIKEFDISSIFPRDIDDPEQTGSKIVCLGKPGSGKSVLLLDIAYRKKHQFPAALIVNGNEDSNETFKKHFPETMIHTELTDELIENLRQRQNIAKKHLENPWLLFIKDECIDTANHFKKPSVVTFYKRARHWDVVSVLGLQYMFEIPLVVRVCIDYAFIFRETNLNSRKIIYENFASIIPTFKLFCKIMDEITGDYTALVIDNRTQTNNPEDCVFWYRAQEIPKDFKFCCEDAWMFNEQRLYKSSNSEAADDKSVSSNES